MAADVQSAYEEVVAEITATTNAATGHMFGMPCLKSDGRAFAGLWGEAMVFKLAGAAHGEALGLAGAALFDPSDRGRPMREWVVVPAAHAERWAALARRAQAYVAGTDAGE